MDYRLESLLTATRDDVVPSLKRLLDAKRDEAKANTAMAEAELVEQDERNAYYRRNGYRP